jgi:hypothetical protein
MDTTVKVGYRSPRMQEWADGGSIARCGRLVLVHSERELNAGSRRPLAERK